MEFQSTLPLRGATCGGHTGSSISGRFQSTLPLRGATNAINGIDSSTSISIHAPLAGSDQLGSVSYADKLIFQSTLPLRGATPAASATSIQLPDFNPRSPCGERPTGRGIASAVWPFQSTLPLRGATNELHAALSVSFISIHAPLAGSDLHTAPGSLWASAFQSTLPLRGATLKVVCCEAVKADFNPRSPCGERPDRLGAWSARRNFNPRSPCGERQQPRPSITKVLSISIHAPLAGSDAAFLQRYLRHRRFQSTLPLRGATVSLPW